jgi:hypothetical protein
MNKMKYQIIAAATLIIVIFGFALLSQGQTQKPVPTTEDPQAWAGLTPEQITKVKTGQMVILSEDQSQGAEQKRFIRCAMTFDQPIDKVWALIIATERQDEYLPGLIKSILVKRDATQDWVDYSGKALFIKLNYRTHHRYDPEHYSMEWSLDPTVKHDLNHLEGFWRLYAMPDGRTLARYGTKVIPSSFLPESVQDFLTRRNLPENLAAVRMWINSAGTYHK